METVADITVAAVAITEAGIPVVETQEEVNETNEKYFLFEF